MLLQKNPEIKTLKSNSPFKTPVIPPNTESSAAIIAIAKLKSSLIAQIIAQGIITVPEPKIGNASTNPMNIAINKGNDAIKDCYNNTNTIVNEKNEIITNSHKLLTKIIAIVVIVASVIPIINDFNGFIFSNNFDRSVLDKNIVIDNIDKLVVKHVFDNEVLDKIEKMLNIARR